MFVITSKTGRSPAKTERLGSSGPAVTLSASCNHLTPRRPTDCDALTSRARVRQAFHDDLEAKRGAVDATIARCSRMLCETSNAAAADIKLRLNAMRSQARVVCALSAERLAGLQVTVAILNLFSRSTKKKKIEFLFPLVVDQSSKTCVYNSFGFRQTSSLK